MSTRTRDGQFGIDVRSMKTQKESWGTDTVTSITEIMQDAISRISEIFKLIIRERIKE